MNDGTNVDHPDPALREHVIAVRNRFGVDGLRAAQRLIAEQITAYEDAYEDLEALG